MDVILIQPRDRLNRNPASKSQHYSVPLGLLAVATPLDVAGYRVKILDQRLEPDWERILLAELKTAPVCVGITAMTGPGIFWAIKISQLVKNNSNIPVVWGGVHGSILPEQTLRNPFIDILVMEEGEETFLELVKALSSKQSLDQVKGIWYKDGSNIRKTPFRPRIDLNKQPLLAYHLINEYKYIFSVAGKNCLSFETSRGCPYSCTFCYNTCFHKAWRSFSSEQTLARIRHTIEKTGSQGLAFSDDNFFLDLDRVYRILEGMVRGNFNLIWGKGDIRLDALAKLDDDFLKLIQKSGCVNLVVGVESGSQRIADAIRKDIDVSQAVPLNRKLAKYDIHIQYLFLLGTPDETLQDLANTGALMRQLVNENQKATTGIQIFVPYPGTELFNTAIQRGHITPQSLEGWIPYAWMNRSMKYPWLTPEKRKAIQMVAFCGLFLPGDRNMNAFNKANPLVSYFARAYSPIAQKRVKGMHYGFLPELRAAELLGYKGY